MSYIGSYLRPPPPRSLDHLTAVSGVGSSPAHVRQVLADVPGGLSRKKGDDQEMAQSERNSHSKNRGGKN